MELVSTTSKCLTTAKVSSGIARSRTITGKMATCQDYKHIVREQLGMGNYQIWKTEITSFFKGQGLWRIISENPPSGVDEHQAWETKNQWVLHIILISCKQEAFFQISKEECARSAWNTLATLYGPTSEVPVDVEEGYVARILLPPDSFHKLAEEKKWKEAFKLIDCDRRKIYDIHMGRTVLHVSVIYNKEDLAMWLVRRMPQNLLAERDNEGRTALAVAADLGRSVQLAESMIKEDPSLLGIKTNEGLIPVLLSSAKGNKELTRFLFKATPLEILRGPSNSDGACIGDVLFLNCINNQILDVASLLLDKCPEVSLTFGYPIYQLAKMHYAFLNESEMGLCYKFLYKLITKWIGTSAIRFCQELPGTKGTLDRILSHINAAQLLKQISEKVKQWNDPELHNAKVLESMLKATQVGNLEFLVLMGEAKPSLLSFTDATKKGIPAHAILNQQGKIVDFISSQYNPDKWLKASHKDKMDNTILHIAAMAGCSSQRDSKSGWGQLQKNLQMYEAVEEVADPHCKEAKNCNGKTPSQLFHEVNEEELKEAIRWAKSTAESFSHIAFVILPITFAALLTVPGGNNQNSGLPIFKSRYLFKLYATADYISLVFCIASALFFKGVQISHFNDISFLKWVPKIFIFGLFTINLSALSMMISSGAAVSLYIRGHPEVQKLSFSFAAIPIIIFLVMQFGLFVEIIDATYRPKFFSLKNMKIQKEKFY